MTMAFDSIRLLVEDYEASFHFYGTVLGLRCTWGTLNSAYAGFAIGEQGAIALFRSDAMAEVVGNAELPLPRKCREKFLICLRVDNVDDACAELKAKGVPLVMEPTDMPTWTIRAAHFRDPEGNLIEIYSGLPIENWDAQSVAEYETYRADGISK